MAQASARGRVLLTGATGVIGQAVRPLLEEKYDVVCLTHKASPTGVQTLAGDIRQPRLGLWAGDYADLAQSVTHVLHCAAVTDFDHLETERTNVSGTENVVRLARDANAHMIHVSTAFVDVAATERTGPARYAHSKLAAEELVRSASCSVTIARPSIVIGDSVTGAIARYQGVYRVAGAVLSGRLPIAPFSPGWRLDIIPQDVVARALVALLEPAWVGREAWLTTGGQAPSLAEVAAVLAALSAELGRPAAVPKFIDPETYTRLIAPVMLPVLAPEVRAALTGIMQQMALYMCRPTAFESSLDQLLPESPVRKADLLNVFVRCMRRWVADQTSRAASEEGALSA